MNFLRKYIQLSIIVICIALPVKAQQKQADYVQYITKYAPLAVKHMSEHHIPASITLAQGLLESGAGKSTLARDANNHFGIKCASDWKGKRIYHDDDRAGECFRKYNRPEDSYNDHSLFLTRRPRYAGLFTLNTNDYKGWAVGLQKAGYATDPTYASKLIKIIETYELYAYDSKKRGKLSTKFKFKRQIYISQGLLYVEVKTGDTWESIASELGFRRNSLLKYNEAPKNFPLKYGDVIYLQPKNKRAEKRTAYTVKAGDSMHRISQKFGIKVKYLYRMNRKNRNYIPSEGDVLKLR
ncbi:MAG: glucosaminidase domain-containing protein [Dysgonamonadaceae bacterium]|jgi:LysM repeat protein|nr:glucosaminidase domain-containing protein [Dysgonamonadaceae bacterium]